MRRQLLILVLVFTPFAGAAPALEWTPSAGNPPALRLSGPDSALLLICPSRDFAAVMLFLETDSSCPEMCLERPMVPGRLHLDRTDWPIRLSGGDAGISLSTGSRQRGPVSQVFVDDRLVGELASTRSIHIDSPSMASALESFRGITNPHAVAGFQRRCERFWDAAGKSSGGGPD